MGRPTGKRTIVCLLRFLAVCLAPVVLIASGSMAADIRLSEETPRHIVIEGEVLPGDYEKFVDAVLEGGASYRTVFLASPGGASREALRIGRLIRSLRYTTVVGSVSPLGPKGGVFCPHYIKKENCTCLSACPVIYLAGVERRGEILGVHRIYVRHERLKQMSFDEAKRVSDMLTASLTKYLDEMGTPIVLKEKILATASDQIEMLDRDYVQKNLSGYAPGYEEWFLARCGSTRQTYQTLRNATDRDAPQVYERYKRIIECGMSELEKESQRRFYLSIVAALKEIDRKFVPSGSVLSKVTPTNSMADALGKVAPDGMLSLVPFGAGWDRKLDYTNLKDIARKFSGLFDVIFDGDARIVDIGMWANNVPFNAKEKAYIGMFHDGLTTAASPNEVVAKIGRPIHEGCLYTGICLLDLENEKFILKTFWEPDRTTLRSLRFKARER